MHSLTTGMSERAIKPRFSSFDSSPLLYYSFPLAPPFQTIPICHLAVHLFNDALPYLDGARESFAHAIVRLT